MIYGPTITGLHWPEGIRCQFAARLDANMESTSTNNARWQLAAIVENESELSRVVQIIGQRPTKPMIHAIERGAWIGVYVSLPALNRRRPSC